MKARIVKRAEAIAELPDGRWLNRHTGRYHTTAHGALAAVNRRARALVEANPDAAAITVVEWHTVSKVGSAVARALGGAR